MDNLADLQATGGPVHLKNAMTVLTMVQFIAEIDPGAAAAAQMVLDLLPPLSAKHYGDAMRGMVAAAVATLRAVDMENPKIAVWLDKELKVRKLDFAANNAMRWFYDCNSNENGKASQPPTCATMDGFKAFRPDILQKWTEPEAKRHAANILDTVVALKAAPLARTRRD